MAIPRTTGSVMKAFINTLLSALWEESFETVLV
jgi:hypothetical protein